MTAAPPATKTPFTGDPEADALLASDGLALLIGMLLDQQVPMEWAFRGPVELKRRLGGSLSATVIAARDPEQIREAFLSKPALHRYPAAMADRVHALCTFVTERYGGRAEKIWTGAKTPEELFGRLRELPGYGEQKAQIFLAILGKRLGVAPAGWEEKAGKYGPPGYRCIADVAAPGDIEKVRAYKQEMKRKARSG